MSSGKFTDWIPARITLGDVTTVDWVYYAETRYREPFIHQTIDTCMSRPFNRLFRHQTPIDELIAWASESPGIPPTGFIYHVSRCGSTLISNLLGDLSSSIKISEAPPLDTVIRARTRLPQLTEEQQIAWIRAVTSGLAQRRTEEQRRVFIKLDAWNTMSLPLLRKAFPETPWVFSYRDPVEVMVSALKSRGAHLIPMAIPPDLFGMTMAEALQISPEEYAARALSAIYEAGLRYHEPGRSLLVSHEQLPEVVWTDVAPFFGVAPSEAQVAQMMAESATHAKTRFVFTPDSKQKRDEATAVVRELSSRWIAPVFERLEAARSVQQASSSLAS